MQFCRNAQHREPKLFAQDHHAANKSENWQAKPDPSYPTTKGLTCPSTLPHQVATTPFPESSQAHLPGNPDFLVSRTQPGHPLTSSLCSPNHCPRSDPFLTEPPPSPQPDPHVMKGINMAKPPAQPSSFPAAPARPLID